MKQPPLSLLPAKGNHHLSTSTTGRGSKPQISPDFSGLTCPGPHAARPLFSSAPSSSALTEASAGNGRILLTKDEIICLAINVKSSIKKRCNSTHPCRRADRPPAPPRHKHRAAAEPSRRGGASPGGGASPQGPHASSAPGWKA